LIGKAQFTASAVSAKRAATLFVLVTPSAGDPAFLPVEKGRTRTQNNIYVDVGHVQIPVGYESLLSSSALPLVERALMFTQRDPFDGGYGDVRETGVQLRGTQGQFEYRLGVFNGFGDRQNSLAVSDAKAVLGMLTFKPKAIEGLQVGVSGGTGNTGFRQAGSLLPGPRADRDILNAFAVYNRDKLTLQAEYLEGSGVAHHQLGSSGGSSDQCA
jgi:hypothetical protein